MALSKLRIQLINTPPFDPESKSKGKVERPFGMFFAEFCGQDRIKKEFRDNDIKDLNSANPVFRREEESRAME